ncbi:unnamed protein product, partial [marine sediment metagenome]
YYPGSQDYHLGLKLPNHRGGSLFVQFDLNIKLL